MDNSKITIEAMISADVETVWNLWTKPEHITKWNFASDDWHCPRAENDLRAGGKYMARMEAKDESFGFDFEAIYDEVINHEKIRYSLPEEGQSRVVTTHFEKVGEKTKVTTVFDVEQENPAEMQRQGWQAILDNFKSYAESNRE